jgi:hypothetical protein
MSQRRPLDVIQVANPCPASWEQMSGDDKRRFCTHCSKYVHNLSAMPADEAERLVCEDAGNLCVRFAQDPASGRVITLDYAPRPRTWRLRAMLVVASLLATGSIAAAWAAYELFLKPSPPPVQFILGDVALPMPAPTQAPPSSL